MIATEKILSHLLGFLWKIINRYRTTNLISYNAHIFTFKLIEITTNETARFLRKSFEQLNKYVNIWRNFDHFKRQTLTCKSTNNPWRCCGRNARRSSRFQSPPTDPTRVDRTLARTPGALWTCPTATAKSTSIELVGEGSCGAATAL